MQALRIHEHGDPSVLRLDDVPEPEPGPGQILAKVLAASVNHLDLWVRRGMPGVRIPFPRTLGCDAVGEVVALGEGVEGFAVGQRVVLEPGFSSGESAHDRAGYDHLSDDYGIRGEHSDGYDCEYFALESRLATPLPDGVDPIEAAAVPLVFVTAWGMVVTRANVQAGETVLVLGGASGVGSAAIQIARDLGARVLATAGSDPKREHAAAMGAHEVIDHTDPDWGKAVKRLTEGRGVDVVIEHVGPATWDQSMRALARNGRLVTCGATTGPTVSLLLPHLFIKNIAVHGSTMGPRNAFPTIYEKVADGTYRPGLHEAIPLSEGRRAHELLEGRAVVGKVVLVPGR